MERQLVVEVALETLRLGLSPRSLDDRHVELLQQCPSPLPPILVHRETMTVVDGLHRFHAARRSGFESIAVVWFEGTFEEAAIEAVRANVGHGKPLSVEQRRRAVTRVLEANPFLSDRAVAEICGLSPKTVAAVRLGAGEQVAHPNEVIGRDGRRQSRAHSHPVVSSAVLRAKTDATDADNGTGAATAPRTNEVKVLSSKTSPLDAIDRSAVLWWEVDEALKSRSPALVAWLSATNPVVSGWPEMIAALPASRTYALTDEARRRADIWMGVAAQLERRH